MAECESIIPQLCGNGLVPYFVYGEDDEAEWKRKTCTARTCNAFTACTEPVFEATVCVSRLCQCVLMCDGGGDDDGGDDTDTEPKACEATACEAVLTC